MLSKRKFGRKIFKKQPQGYGDGTNRVCLLIKALYGLKKGQGQWQKRFHEHITKRGFKYVGVTMPCTLELLKKIWF